MTAGTADMAETADTATNPKTIPPAVFQKRAGGKNTLSTTVLTKILSLLKICFLNEAIALRKITTKGSISLTINLADMLVMFNKA